MLLTWEDSVEIAVFNTEETLLCPVFVMVEGELNRPNNNRYTIC